MASPCVTVLPILFAFKEALTNGPEPSLSQGSSVSDLEGRYPKSNAVSTQPNFSTYRSPIAVGLVIMLGCHWQAAPHVLLSSLSPLFINVIGDTDQGHPTMDYGNVAISVVIYLGIPRAEGMWTSFVVQKLRSLTPSSLRWPTSDCILLLFANQMGATMCLTGFEVSIPSIPYSTDVSANFLSTFDLTNSSTSARRRVFDYAIAVVQDRVTTS
ncbi:hypothetical protein BKA70DRAFT_1519680 [Coprinopsis sp. MPI-PUGE-AT-0042]|nr:hypothetical protein BKA70DRAFT_1519680 [Coprinopsis sp. MPI-PUGE-AT-0042]